MSKHPMFKKKIGIQRQASSILWFYKVLLYWPHPHAPSQEPDKLMSTNQPMNLLDS